MFAAVGCDERLDAGASHNSASASINAGVVIADREGYLCLPLQRVGLEAEATIVSLSSSCECIRPCLVKYKVPGNSTQQGIVLEFVAEPTEGDASTTENSAADLSVIIETTLADGVKHCFTVDLLHTVLTETLR